MATALLAGRQPLRLQPPPVTTAPHRSGRLGFSSAAASLTPLQRHQGPATLAEVGRPTGGLCSCLRRVATKAVACSPFPISASPRSANDKNKGYFFRVGFRSADAIVGGAFGRPRRRARSLGIAWRARGGWCAAGAAKGKYYRVLGLEEDASGTAVKSAYRRAVRRCHPDVDSSPAAARRFQAISTAYAVLSKPTLRSVYDKYGLAGVRSFLDGKHPQHWTPARKFAGTPERGEDIKTVVEIPLEDALLGGNAVVEFESRRYCGACQGSGFRPDTREADCELCRGSGAVTRSNRPHAGGAPSICPCPDCGGSGVWLQEYCDECIGGRCIVTDRVGVKIPAGIMPGAWIKLSMKGDVGKYGGASGDLYIGVQTAEHSSIQRYGDDLYSEIQLSFLQAVLGGEAPVRTITNQHTSLTIPQGTQHGALLALPGAGAPIRKPGVKRDGRGTHFFQVSLKLPGPGALDEAQLELLHRLRSVRQQQQRPGAEEGAPEVASR